MIAFDLTARQINRSGVPFEVFESGVQLWRSSDVRDRWNWRTTGDGVGRLYGLYGLCSLRTLKRGSHVGGGDFKIDSQLVMGRKRIRRRCTGYWYDGPEELAQQSIPAKCAIIRHGEVLY